MSTDDDRIKYFKQLEIPPESTITEINMAYNHLKKLYSRESIVTSPLADELTDEQRKEILSQVEEAYAILMESLSGGESERDGIPPPGPDRSLHKEFADAFFSGETLKMIRERMGVSLHDIELATKVRAEYLKNIELEQYGVLPEKVFVKGYIQAFAKYLMLNPHRVLSDYMKGYDRWESDKEDKAR